METSKENISTTLQGVLKSPNLSSINGLYIVLRNAKRSDKNIVENTQDYLLDDDAIIRLIEETHHFLFDDFVGKHINPIRIDFREALTKSITLNGKTFKRITAVKAIRASSESGFQQYNKINHPCPAPNKCSGYVKAPISYKYPEWGTFRLYYEVNSNFDSSKPIVLIPTDAQRGSSQVGMADQYRKIFDISFNVLTYEYRGQFCSSIPEFQKRGWTWEKAYLAFNSDNAVEDIELIRKHLLGDKKICILGGSGIAMLGLKYLVKYHKHVSRAFLMSFFKDAEGGSRSGVSYFDSFLKNFGLTDKYAKIIKEKIVPLDQLLFLLQRLLYSDEKKAIKLINETSSKDIRLFIEESKTHGSVDFFVRFVQKYSPQAVAFMYETNITTSLTGEPDINSPFLQIGKPLLEIEKAGKIDIGRFKMGKLDNITTEVLLVAGILDQVAPIKEMRKIRSLMPRSKLAIFKSYHCLMNSESKQCRNRLVEIFFKYGMNSKNFADYLKGNACKDLFVGLE